MNSQKLKIAIQKSGRLIEDSIKLLKACGIRLANGLGKLKSEAQNFPLEIFFLRDDDIPQYIADGVADIGIVGPAERVFYVSQKSVYVWVTDWSARTKPNQNGSMLYQMPLDGSAPTALGVSGSPVDQFSFPESEDGFSVS